MHYYVLLRLPKSEVNFYQSIWFDWGRSSRIDVLLHMWPLKWILSRNLSIRVGHDMNLFYAREEQGQPEGAVFVGGRRFSFQRRAGRQSHRGSRTLLCKHNFHFDLDNLITDPWSWPPACGYLGAGGAMYQINSLNPNLELFVIQEGGMQSTQESTPYLVRSPGRSQPIAERSPFKNNQRNMTKKKNQTSHHSDDRSSQVSGTWVVIRSSRESTKKLNWCSSSVVGKWMLVAMIRRLSDGTRGSSCLHFATDSTK